MTNEQKKCIESLRKEGKSYGEISRLLNISRSTVSSFCKALDEGYKTCPVCGSRVKKVKNCRPRIFCCSKCRIEYWRANNDKANRKHNAEFACLCCGKKFTGYKSKNRKFCSKDCYLKFRYGGGDDEAK